MRSVAGMIGAAKEVHPDFVPREVVDRRMPVLKHDHGVGRVDDRRALEYHAYVPRGPLKRHWKPWSPAKSGRRAGIV